MENNRAFFIIPIVSSCALFADRLPLAGENNFPISVLRILQTIEQTILRTKSDKCKFLRNYFSTNGGNVSFDAQKRKKGAEKRRSIQVPTDFRFLTETMVLMIVDHDFNNYHDCKRDHSPEESLKSQPSFMAIMVENHATPTGLFLE